MLEIEKLSLTHEELTEAFVGDALHGFERIAEAQLAKAAHGFLVWLKGLEEIQIHSTPLQVMEELVFEFATAIEEAGIKEPRTEEAQAPR